MSKLFVGLALVSVLAVGCFKHSYTVGSGGNVDGEAAYDKWASHWLFGIIGESDVDLKTVCPSGNATIKDEESFVNGLIHALIGIIWAPTTVTIYCDGGGAAPAADAPAAEEPAAPEGEPAAPEGEPAPEASLSKGHQEISFVMTPADVRALASNPKLLSYVQQHVPARAADLQAALESFRSNERAIAARAANQL